MEQDNHSRSWRGLSRSQIGRRKLIRGSGVAALGLAGAWVVGCGSDEDTPSTPAGGTPAPSNGESTPPEQVTRGGTFEFRLTSDPPNLDPHRLLNVSRYTITQPLYSGLLRPSYGPDIHPNELHVEPELADSYEAADDTTFVFNLRRGVKFHKNRANSEDIELTADDVLFTMDRMMDDQSIRRHYWVPQVTNVEAPDDYTVRITTRDTYAPLLSFISSMDAHVVSRQIVGDAELLDDAAGTGPFMLEEHRREQSYRLVRNPEYFEDGQPYLDEVVINIIPDESTWQAAFVAGRVHNWGTAQELNRDNMMDRVPDATVHETLGQGGLAMRMITTREPFDDHRVREALILAMDRPALMEAISDGRGERNGPIPAGMADWVHPDVLSLPFMHRDLEGARERLSAAGFSDPSQLRIELPAWNIASQTRYAEVLAEQLRELGVTITVRPVDHVAYNNLQATANYDLFFTTRIAYWDPDEHMYARYHGDSGPLNEAQADDPELNEILERQRTLLDYEERKEVMDRAQEMVAERAYWGYTHEGYSYTFTDPRVRDYHAHMHGNQTRMLRLAWLDT